MIGLLEDRTNSSKRLHLPGYPTFDTARLLVLCRFIFLRRDTVQGNITMA